MNVPNEAPDNGSMPTAMVDAIVAEMVFANQQLTQRNINLAVEIARLKAQLAQAEMKLAVSDAAAAAGGP